MAAPSPAPTVVDFWFDPVCPYSWTASRWLHHVAGQTPLELRHHVISLYALNEHRTDLDPSYRRTVEQARGPARVAAAIAETHDSDTVGEFYTQFGERNFDVWHHPDEAEQHEWNAAARVLSPVLRVEAHPTPPAGLHLRRKMSTMTPTEVDALWTAIDDQRKRTADLLERLDPVQWMQPSLCDGWRVRHVAAHLTLQQQSIRDILSFTAAHPRLLRSLGLNRTIHDSAVIQADDLTNAEIITRIRAMVGSRRHNLGVTPLETLTDILVHSQDIAIPLGLDLTMDPHASELAATRWWATRRTWFSAVFRKLPLDGLTIRATDVDWTRGDGPEVAGPIGALLLLLCGRRAALTRLHGPGVEVLRAHT